VTQASADEQQRLLAVQQIDTAVRRLRHRRANLPEQQALDDQATLLDKVTAEHLAASDELVAVGRRMQRLEHDVSAVDSRRRTEEARMYSGQIATEREVDALRRELSSLKTRKRDLEDELLEVMERNEELTGTVDTLVARRDELRASVAPLEQARDAAATDIDDELAEQERQRAELADQLPEAVLAVYDDLRARKDGLAVAELRHGVCQGCHLELTAGELAEGREIGRLGMARCVQCGRLLVEPDGE
jgi:predicted  nucleic acid-binding Zn-ribbon protein